MSLQHHKGSSPIPIGGALAGGAAGLAGAYMVWTVVVTPFLSSSKNYWLKQ